MLDNLVENALNYSPPDTTVAIEWGATAHGCAAGRARRGPGDRPGRARARVRALLPRRGGRGGAPGTGLGLSVVEALAQRWGGSVELRGAPEGGTRAEVVLPLAVGDRTEP